MEMIKNYLYGLPDGQVFMGYLVLGWIFTKILFTVTDERELDVGGALCCILLWPLLLVMFSVGALFHFLIPRKYR